MKRLLKCLAVVSFSLPSPAGAGLPVDLYPDAATGVEKRASAFSFPGASPATGGTAFAPAFSELKGGKVTFAIPARIKEGKGGKAVIRSSFPASRDIRFKISVDSKSGLRLPSTVTLAKGKKQCSFAFSSKNDKSVNLTRDVAVEVSSDGFLIAKAGVTVLDDEKPPVLRIQTPSRVTEGKKAAEGTLTLGRAVDVDCQVSFDSSPAGQLAIPPVTIPAGEKSVKFQVRGVEDGSYENDMDVVATARIAGMAPASGVTKVIDGNPRAIRLDFPKMLTDGEVDWAYVALGGTVNQDVVVKLESDGSSYLKIPSQVTIPKGSAGTSFNIEVIDGSVLDESHVVRVDVSAPGFAGAAASIVAVETLRAGRTFVLPLAVDDLAGDPVRNRIYASVGSEADGPYRDRVVAVDPATREVVASVDVGPSPGRLAVTSGGEALYVCTRDNRTIKKIRTSDFTVESEFHVGGSLSSRRTAEHICTVPGQPDLLVVSLRREGVAVYDHGVPRNSHALVSYLYGARIEPSADPAVYFVLTRNQDGDGILRALQLSADGMSLLDGVETTVTPYTQDFRSHGDIVIDSEGGVHDGKQMRRIGDLNLEWGESFLTCSAPGSGRFLVYRNGGNPKERKITVHDAATLAAGKEIDLDDSYGSPGLMIRWGECGLAFGGGERLIVTENRYLMPVAPSAGASGGFVSAIQSVTPMVGQTAVRIAVERLIEAAEDEERSTR
ncbi:hypothetical protein JIN84_06155 [Luteolibacter yonseiensis]|uniref:Uncharacterized protein n=1 Tax=Luteolibacter yonseiensis TaxID=1144680 RepID=A0A934R1G2_9BACT|nr:hypothetical protein [Luteolibacter yonseiensis]MBK1815186.1 hypothetical protein [Luteolibacter yonseiensis]